MTNKQLPETGTGTAKTVEALNFVSLADILKADVVEMSALKKGEFQTEKLGLVPFSALSWSEVGHIKKECFKVSAGKRKGQVEMDLNETRAAVLYILAAVDKDERSDFTFYSKELMLRFGVDKAEHLVPKLLSPGEIQEFSYQIQIVSDLVEPEKEENEDQESAENVAKN